MKKKKTYILAGILIVLAVVLLLLLRGCERNRPATPAARDAARDAAGAEAAADELRVENRDEKKTPDNAPERPGKRTRGGEDAPEPSAEPSAEPGAEPSAEPTAAPSSAPAASAAPTPKPTAAPTHSHSWTETSRTAATCEAAGSVTYKCSCGETKTETIPALGHDWQPVYTTEEYPIYGEAELHWIDNGCGMDITAIVNNDEAMKQHVKESGNPNCMGYHSVYVYPIDGYESEDVLTGYVCSHCGATKAP